MAVPRWLKLLLPLFVFVAFFRALIGAGDFDLYDILLEFEQFEFDTTGIKKIIYAFDSDFNYNFADAPEFSMGDFNGGNITVSADSYGASLQPLVASSSDSSKATLRPLITYIPSEDEVLDDVEYYEDTDFVKWFNSFCNSILVFFQRFWTFIQGVWLILVEVVTWIGRVFKLVFRILGIV